MIGILIDGVTQLIQPGERLIDVINRSGAKLPQVCHHPQLGPIQTCDTCMVETDGRLVRACAATVSAGMVVSTNSGTAAAAQRERPSIASSAIMFYIARCATTITETAPSTTRRSCWQSSIRPSPITPSLTKRIILIRSTATIRNNAFFAAAASRLARALK